MPLTESGFKYIGEQIVQAFQDIGIINENSNEINVVNVVLAVSGLGDDPMCTWLRLQARDLYLVAIGVCYGKGIEFDVDIFNGWLAESKLPFELVNGPYSVIPDQRREPVFSKVEL